MKAKILVVDDEPDITYTLKATLEETGLFVIYPFNEPGLVLSNFRPNMYDLAILDIRMPQMNGFELFHEIRKIDEKVKVCFLTAVSELTEYTTAIKKIIKKPIDNVELAKQIKRILNPHALQANCQQKCRICQFISMLDKKKICSLIC